MSIRASDPPAAAPTIHVRGLRKRYGRRLALAGADLTLASGQIVGVVGPDGAGKTTLLRALAGLLEVEADEALVLGYDLRGDVTELKARIGYVPQAFSLQRDLSIIENLRFTARLHRLSAADFDARTTALLARTGLARFRDRRAGALSGGMKQKLAVANALLSHPALLVLDEATAGVDVVARGEIWDVLQQQRSEALVLLSTSYLEEAAGCDRLVYLDHGRVLASGTPAELRALAAVGVYRVWGDDGRTIARAARQLPYVESARGTGRFARIDVRRAPSLERARVLNDLRALPGATVHLAEEMPVDMESTILALARSAQASEPPLPPFEKGGSGGISR